MKYITRSITDELVQSSQEMPVIALLGPRQSGKSTLARQCFPEKPYISLEDLEPREFARNDPIRFLERYREGAVFDEIQRVPDLFSYLQTEVDRDDRPGRFILTGSHQFSLVEKINQSLAGRIRLLRLLPFSIEELRSKNPALSLDQLMFSGLYPRIHANGLRPSPWLGDYFESYVQKDVRMIKSIGDLDRFIIFVKMLAARVGQLLNLTALGNDCGISHNTARSWLNVLEASFIVFTLQPHHKNFNKRLVKTPKVYFYDSGLLCYLLQIGDPRQLEVHSQRGSIFESFIIAELTKAYFNQGARAPLSFWRDKGGHEIDLIIEKAGALLPVEIKSSKTISSSFFQGLNYWQGLAGDEEPAYLIYGGEESYKREGAYVVGWLEAANEVVFRGMREKNAPHS